MHRLILRSLIIVSFLGLNLTLFSQQIPIGTWQDHLPYNDAVSITEGNNIIYCATNSAVFTYDKSSFELSRLNQVNQLSDIGVTKIIYNPQNSRVVIAYKNGNIDVITEDDEIINLAHIKNSSIIGDKVINDIYLKGKYAYLATGFGIVVLDTDKLEIKETYLIGSLGSYVFVNAITIDNNNIYAATDEGVYFADKNSPILVDYNAWSKIPDLGNNPYENIVYFSNKLFLSHKSEDWNGDTVLYNNLGTWQKFIPTGTNINSIDISKNSLIISFRDYISQYDTSLTNPKTIYSFQNQFSLRPQEAVIDKDNFLLIADAFNGVVRTKDGWNGEVISSNSPSSANAFNMDFVDNNLWTVSGGYGIGLDQNLVNHKTNEEWATFNINIKDINGGNAHDMVAVTINPSNTNQVFVGSWLNGLFEYNNDNVINIYTGQNSGLDTVFYGITAIGAMDFDDNGNLWVLSSFSANYPLAVKTADNDWYSYSFTGLTNSSDFYTDILIDENNYKWFISTKYHKIIVFDDNGTLSNKSDDRKKLNTNFPGSGIECIVQDKDGEIWIGTDEGVAVFYNPNDVFDENIEAEQILIQQDGQTQILLETEIVTSIAIDGANRKWIGTQNSGIYLMSEDGTEEVEHFSIDNSPLFSNSIYDIVIDPKTGEVFIGTEKGLISYKGTATEPDEDFNNVFVYPNPVKPDFSGTIAIRGLVKDTDVRITDISGNIVYETTSLGGQAVWNGNDMNGNRVQSGVYMVFNGSPEGTKKAAAKILFIN